MQRAIITAFWAAALCASLAHAQTVTPAAPPPVVVMPRVVPSPSTTPTTCTFDETGKPKPCPQTFPTLAPVPVIPPVPTDKPRTALSAAPARGVAAIDGEKVLSYFQRGATHIDTKRAFGFVLIPKSAVTDAEWETRVEFCRLMLASLEFTSPEEAARRTASLATYWPLKAEHEPWEIEAAFADGDCDRLLGWYDHNLARRIAARAGVADLSGPLLITWPSEGRAGAEARSPLVVDFAKADHDRAKKALAYWFRQLRNRPELWTSRIREGTIRAELADAINDTAGVVVAMLAGKWDSVKAVSDTP